MRTLDVDRQIRLVCAAVRSNRQCLRIARPSCDTIPRSTSAANRRAAQAARDFKSNTATETCPFGRPFNTRRGLVTLVRVQIALKPLFRRRNGRPKQEFRPSFERNCFDLERLARSEHPAGIFKPVWWSVHVTHSRGRGRTSTIRRVRGDEPRHESPDCVSCPRRVSFRSTPASGLRTGDDDPRQ